MTPRAMDTTEKPTPKPVMDVMPPHPHEGPKPLAAKPPVPPPSPRAAAIATPPDNVKLAPSHHTATVTPATPPTPKPSEPATPVSQQLTSAGHAGAPVAPPPDNEHDGQSKEVETASQDLPKPAEAKPLQPKKVPHDSPIGAIIITVLVMIALSALVVLVYLNS